MNLPSKDRKGNSYLSYSEISLFLKDKDAYLNSYINKKAFVSNEYIEFGNKVGKALELNDFSNFSESEKITLQKVTRLDIFERPVFLRYDDFYIIGYIDTCDSRLTKIIDYKTGGKDKDKQYLNDDYTQMNYYSLAIKQETGSFPKSVGIEFIQRKGNLYKGESLTVSNEPIISISLHICENKLKRLYWNTIDIAKEISNFYKINRK